MPLTPIPEAPVTRSEHDEDSTVCREVLFSDVSARLPRMPFLLSYPNQAFDRIVEVNT